MQVIGSTGRVINLPDQLAKKLIEKNRVKEASQSEKQKEAKQKKQEPKQKEAKQKK